MNFVCYEERVHVPPQITQKGIADVTGIRVNHIPRTVRKLTERGEVEEYLAYVHGASRRRKAYSLSDTGRARALEVQQSVGSMEITTTNDDGEHIRTTLTEILGTFGKEYTLLELSDIVDEKGELDRNKLNISSSSGKVHLMHDAPNTKGFVGRVGEMKKFDEWIVDDEKKLLVLSGIKGTGKSWFASEFVKRNADDWNYLYIDIGPTKGPGSIVSEFNHFLGMLELQTSEMDLIDFAQVVLNRLTEKKVLLILDNYYGVNDGVERFVSKLARNLSKVSDVKMIVLTKETEVLGLFSGPDIISSTEIVRLPGLSKDEARELFEEVNISEESLEVILDMTKGNPLALTIVFSDEVNRLVDDMPDLSDHEALMLRCLKAMNIVLST